MERGKEEMEKEGNRDIESLRKRERKIKINRKSKAIERIRKMRQKMIRKQK